MREPTPNGRVSVSRIRDRKQFLLTVRPDIAIRVKRWFRGAEQQGGTNIYIAASMQNAHDLATLLYGYPMEMDDAATELLTQLRAAHDERNVQIAAALRGGRAEDLVVDMAIPPRPYQLEVVQLLRATRGLLLADDMGLGKTISAIACVCGIADLRPAIVVAPSGVLPVQWERQIHRFAPSLTTHVVRAGKPYDVGPQKGKRRNSKNSTYDPDSVPDVLIIGYSVLHGWADVLAAPPWRSVIYDEVQGLRRGTDTVKGSAAAAISAHVLYRLGLSGTPVYNYGDEMFEVVEMIAPGFLGSRTEFEREWCDMTTKRVRHPDALGIRVREAGVMLRRRRADVGQELPPVSTVITTVDCDPEQITRVAGQAGELARTLLAQMGVSNFQKMQTAEMLLNLLRLATGIAKAPSVARAVRQLVSEGRRVLLYGWHRAVYDIWRQCFDQLEDGQVVRHRMITGSESAAEKNANLTAFMAADSTIDVLIVSLRAGAGMDGLQHVCSTVVFGELDWSPKVHEQCITRLDRDGQREPVLALYCTSKVGIDPIMIDVCGAKRRQSDPMMDPDQFLDDQLLGSLPDDLSKRVAQSVLDGDLLREREVDDV